MIIIMLLLLLLLIIITIIRLIMIVYMTLRAEGSSASQQMQPQCHRQASPRLSARAFEKIIYIYIYI